MTNVEIAYTDFELLMELYNEHAKGKNLYFSIDASGNLRLRTRNVYDEELEILIYRADGDKGNLMPKIKKEDRLGNFLQRQRSDRKRN